MKKNKGNKHESGRMQKVHGIGVGNVSRYHWTLSENDEIIDFLLFLCIFAGNVDARGSPLSLRNLFSSCFQLEKKWTQMHIFGETTLASIPGESNLFGEKESFW
jgi:hypothetical protein